MSMFQCNWYSSQGGLGSSSSFAVGLLHALYALKGEMVNKKKLAEQAAKIEIDILKSNMGKQTTICRRL